MGQVLVHCDRPLTFLQEKVVGQRMRRVDRYLLRFPGTRRLAVMLYRGTDWPDSWPCSSRTPALSNGRRPSLLWRMPEISYERSCFCEKLITWRTMSKVDVLVCTDTTASLKRGIVNSLFPRPRAKRFPLTFSVKSIPVTTRSKSLGFRIRRSTCRRCSNAVASSGVMLATSTSGGSPLINQEAQPVINRRTRVPVHIRMVVTSYRNIRHKAKDGDSL